MRRLVAAVCATLASLSPAVALACPVCAQREGGGLLGKVALGLLIVAPWIAALAIGLWIRRAMLAAGELGSASGELGAAAGDSGTEVIGIGASMAVAGSRLCALGDD